MAVSCRRANVGQSKANPQSQTALRPMSWLNPTSPTTRPIPRQRPCVSSGVEARACRMTANVQTTSGAASKPVSLLIAAPISARGSSHRRQPPSIDSHTAESVQMVTKRSPRALTYQAASALIGCSSITADANRPARGPTRVEATPYTKSPIVRCRARFTAHIYTSVEPDELIAPVRESTAGYRPFQFPL